MMEHVLVIFLETHTHITSWYEMITCSYLELKLCMFMGAGIIEEPENC